MCDTVPGDIHLFADHFVSNFHQFFGVNEEIVIQYHQITNTELVDQMPDHPYCVVRAEVTNFGTEHSVIAKGAVERASS